MSLLYVSENYENNNNILYVRESLSELFFKRAKARLIADRHRVGLFLSVDDELFAAACEELYDKLADVIAVSYKYAFFAERIKPSGLTSGERELLLSSLISADLDEDKRYIRSRFEKGREYAIDGFFNFRLANLKAKWVEITGYIPDYFSENELKEFIIYLINEKRGKKVIVEGGKVYDGHFNRLKRASLICDGGQMKIIKEVLLSGAGEVELKGELPEGDDKYLKEYFGDKILFGKGDFR